MTAIPRRETRAEAAPGTGGAAAPVLASVADAERPLWRRLLPYAGALFALALFAAAAVILYHEVTAYRPEDVRRALQALGWGQVAAALGVRRRRSTK